MTFTFHNSQNENRMSFRSTFQFSPTAQARNYKFDSNAPQETARPLDREESVNFCGLDTEWLLDCAFIRSEGLHAPLVLITDVSDQYSLFLSHPRAQAEDGGHLHCESSSFSLLWGANCWIFRSVQLQNKESARVSFLTEATGDGGEMTGDKAGWGNDVGPGKWRSRISIKYSQLYY